MEDGQPRHGEVWDVDFDPVRGHEQGRRRPAVVISADTFNAGPAGLVIVCPLTTRERRIRSHVPVDPPDGGLHSRSFVICEQIRAISTERLGRRIGGLSANTVGSIEERLRILLDL